MGTFCQVSATVNGQSWVLARSSRLSPSVKYGDGIDEFDIELNDVVVLEQAATGGALAEPKGRNIAEAVSGHIRQQAGTFTPTFPIREGASPESCGMRGPPYLTIINDMLDYRVFLAFL